MGYLLGLFVALVAFWLAMSGLMKPLMLSLGAVSVAITLFLAMRLDVVDRESAPYLRWPVLLLTGSWLMGEIVKANWRVIRACLKVPISTINPALVKIKTRCKSDLAKTTFRQLDHPDTGHRDAVDRRRQTACSCAL